MPLTNTVPRKVITDFAESLGLDPTLVREIRLTGRGIEVDVLVLEDGRRVIIPGTGGYKTETHWIGLSS